MADAISSQPRKIYSEFYWGLILPAVTAAALIGLLLKRVVVDSLSWWGCVFFVVYYAVQHTRREEPKHYGLVSLVLDSSGVGVFFYVTHEVGLFEPTPYLVERPAWLCFWILSIPILGALGRLTEGKKPRAFLSAAIIVSTIAGGIASNLGQKTLALWCMGFLIAGLVVYSVCNFVEDGGSRKCEKCKFCR
jgi:hypothetical protein